MEYFAATPTGTSNDMIQHATEQQHSQPSTGSYFDELNSTASTRCTDEKGETAKEELRAMFHREFTSYGERFNYLSMATTTTTVEDDPAPEELPVAQRICEGWRQKIAEWCFQVVDHFEFDREVVSIALHYLDRVVSLTMQSTGEQVNKEEFKLIAVASFYLAMKLHGDVATFVDEQRKKLRIDAFVDLSRGLFSIKTLEAKEREILKLLRWKVNPPTTVHFVALLLRLMPSWERVDVTKSSTSHSIFEMSRYLTELATCDSSFSFNYRNSEIAYASILCAMEGLHGKIRLPCAIRIEFLNKMTTATNLSPQTVRALCDQMKELCPNLFVTKERETASHLVSYNTASNSNNTSDMQEPFTRMDVVSPVCTMHLV